MIAPASIAVIGLGNPMRSDDAAGLIVADHLRRRDFPGVSVYTNVTDAAVLIEIWAGISVAYVIDASSSGREPGTVFRIDGLAGDIPEAAFRSQSTHAFGLTTAIRLGRALRRLPASLIIYGIEGKTFNAGESLSAEVEQAALQTVDRLITEIAALESVSP